MSPGSSRNTSDTAAPARASPTSTVNSATVAKTVQKVAGVPQPIFDSGQRWFRNFLNPDWSQFFPTALGVLLGFLGALHLTRRSERSSLEQTRQRHLDILRLVNRELARNDKTLREIEDSLKLSDPILAEVNLKAWNAIPHEIFESLLDIRDRGVASDMVSECYETLETLKRHVELYNQMLAAQNPDARGDFLDELKSILKHALQTTKSAIVVTDRHVR